MLNFFGDLTTHQIDADDGTPLAAVVASSPEGIATRGVALCVHGFTGSKEDFIACLSDIAARGYAALAFDLRGHYESGGADGPFTLERLAADAGNVAAWARDRYAAPVHLVGHSFGGLVAQRAVALFPDAFASLNLVGSGPAGVAVEGAAEQRITIGRLHEIIRALYYKPQEGVWQAKADLEGLDGDDPLVRFLRERFMATSPDALIATGELTLSAPDQTDAAAAVGLPTSWCHGERDGSWAQSTQADAARRLGCAPVAIPDSVHMPMLENIDAFVDFLCGSLDRVASRGM